MQLKNLTEYDINDNTYLLFVHIKEQWASCTKRIEV